MKNSHKIILVVISFSFVVVYSAALWNYRDTDLPQKAVPGSFAVVELFTSQGCSSCPAADRQLYDLKMEALRKALPVYTLAFHVDYWDRLGWKDNFSDQKYTARQYRYAQVFSRKNIYTPQMIVNGIAEFTGSDSDACKAILDSELKKVNHKNIRINGSYSIIKNDVDISYTLSEKFKGYLNIALIQDESVVDIAAGENSGHAIRYTDIVREFKVLELDQQDKGHWRFSLQHDLDTVHLTMLIYLQNKINMQIIGAAKAERI